MKSSKHRAGFTLIELVIVIVILGVLAVTAAPRFIDMTDDAYKSITVAQMGAFKSAVSLMHAKYQVRQESPIIMAGQSVDFTSAGWPRGATASSAGCADLWNKVYADPEPITVLTNYTDTLFEGWNAFYYGEVCGFIKSPNGGGTVYPNTVPHFAYYMADFNSNGYVGSAGDVKIYNMN